MKRILLATAATVVGLVALLGYKSHGHPVGQVGALPSAALSGTSAPPRPQPSTPTTTAPPDPSTLPSASSGTGSAATRTIAGAAVETRYGIVQVQVIVSGRTITNASFLQLTAYDGRSQQINSDAAPILLQQTLSAQSAHIDGVSGASYTSEGYVESLQSALDQAGIK
jgi:uncharacterized protein with FMN-binding domain